MKKKLNSLIKLIETSNNLVDGLFLLKVEKDEQELLDILRSNAQEINQLLNRVRELNERKTALISESG